MMNCIRRGNQFWHDGMRLRCKKKIMFMIVWKPQTSRQAARTRLYVFMYGFAVAFTRYQIYKRCGAYRIYKNPYTLTYTYNRKAVGRGTRPLCRSKYPIKMNFFTCDTPTHIQCLCDAIEPGSKKPVLRSCCYYFFIPMLHSWCWLWTVQFSI